jgi:tRNA nucleotidyltransferase/poly(A) polymerase
MSLNPSTDPGGLRERALSRLSSHPWAPEALWALERLRTAGRQAYLVGGTVRDVLLGREPSPVLDVATDRLPDEVVALFPRVEPIGLAHGTVLVVLASLQLECTTFRREGAYEDARHPDRVEFTKDLRADLARRDLTVNALAFDPWSGVLVDPCGGLADLVDGLLRAVGDPLARFREDALRPLRVARFAATLGLEVESVTRAALGGVTDRARRVALERVGEELRRLLAGARPSAGLELLREAGLLELWMPELARCFGVPQNRWHAYDVYVHSLQTCECAPQEKPRVRWAALLHDIGKPDTRVERRGEGTACSSGCVSRTPSARRSSTWCANTCSTTAPSGVTRRCGAGSDAWGRMRSPTCSTCASRTCRGTGCERASRLSWRACASASRH